MTVRRAAAKVTVVVLFAAACGTDPATGTSSPTTTPSPDATTAEPTKATPIELSSPTGEEIFFPRVRSTGGPLSVPEAMGGGKLVLDRKAASG